MRTNRVNPSGAQTTIIGPSFSWYNKSWAVFLCATNDDTKTTHSTKTLLYG